MSLDEKLIDKRVVERSIKRGRVDAQEYRRALETLPDLSDRVVRVDDASEAASGGSAARPRTEAEATGL